MLLICNYCLTTSQMLKNSTMIEIWYFHFRDFPVSLWNLLLPWLSLKSFISFGKPAVSVESQQPQTEACQTGDLIFSCGVYESRILTLFSPFFSAGCLRRLPGVADIAWLWGVSVFIFSPPLLKLLPATGSLKPS